MRINNQFDSDDPDGVDLEPKAAADLAAFLYGTRPEADGLKIGNYSVIREIGRGGHGVVFLAHREGASDLAAVKLIRRDLADSGSPQRLWRELETLERCRCAAVPKILEHGTHEGNLFIAYEYIEGEGLDVHVRQRSSSVREIVALLISACESVQTIHENGIIHRDLKPSNLLFTPAGEVRVIDLGTACLLEGRSDQSRTIEGTVLGTPACMSPEQARGAVSQISTRSDVFGLGAIGYVLLTGQPPFSMDGAAHEVLRRIGQDQPRRMKDLLSSIPAPLAAILEKASSSDPHQRFGTVAELRAELLRWSQGLPTLTTAPGVLRRSVLFARRRPWAAVSGLAASVLLAVIALLGVTAYSNAQLAEQRADVVREHIQEMRDTAARTRTMLAAGQMGQATLQLALLGDYVRNGGTFEDGLIELSKNIEALAAEIEAKSSNKEEI